MKNNVAEQVPFTERLLPHVLDERMKSDALAPLMAMPLMVMGEVFPFDRVMLCAAVLDPRAALPKETLAGLAVTTPLVPKPDTAMVCGLLLSESVKFKIAVRVPVAVGPKRMFALQLVAGASVAPQVLLKTVKSPGFVPLKVRLPILIAAPFPFVKVTVFWPLLLPIATAAQVRLAGETELAPPDDPEPERGTICGLLVAESTKFRLAVRVPAAAGLKIIVTVQLAETARVPPQVLAETTKSDALAPLMDTLLMEIDELGPFARVTVCGALLVPKLVAA